MHSKMTASVVYSYLEDAKEKFVTHKLEDDWNDAIPLQNMAARRYPFDGKGCLPWPLDDERRREARERTPPEAQPGPSSQMWRAPPQTTEPQPDPNALEVPPQPPTPPADKSNDNNNNNSGNGNRTERGIDKCSMYYLFYITLIQSCLKMTICIMVMSMGFKHVDLKCQDPDSEDCTPPTTYNLANNRHASMLSGAAYFILALCLFILSCIDFCVGLCIFTSNRATELTSDVLKTPMNVFTAVLGIEICVMVLSTQVIMVTHEMMAILFLILITELLAIFIVFLYPHSYYEAVDNPALNVDERTEITGTHTPSRRDIP